MGCSPWDHKELDMTRPLTQTHTLEVVNNGVTSNRQDGIDSFSPALPCKHIYKPGNGSRDSVRITVKCVKKS